MDRKELVKYPTERLEKLYQFIGMLLKERDLKKETKAGIDWAEPIAFDQESQKIVNKSQLKPPGPQEYFPEPKLG